MNSDSPGNHIEKVIHIGIAVVRHADQYLIGTRATDAIEGGKAEFPGGKCEQNESGKDAAIRECLEETGIAVHAVRELEVGRHTNAAGEIQLHFWLCEPDTGEPVPEPTPPFRWVPAMELATLPFPTANASVVALLTSEE